jgi:hypothetical protein
MTDDTVPNEPMVEYQGMSGMPPPPVEPLPISDKLVGILTEPSSTYINVRAAGPRTSDWLLPVATTALILLVGMFLRFSNPEFMSQIMSQRSKALSEQVDSGKMTQEQADQAAEQVEGMKGIIKVGGSLSAGFGFVVMFFVISLLYWVVVRFVLKGDTTFALILSAAGLSTYISAIDQLVGLLLTFLTGKAFANLSPMLFMDGDITSTSSRMMMMLNPIAIWSYVVLGIGFQYVANISRTKAMIVAFGFFVLSAGLGALGGFGM